MMLVWIDLETTGLDNKKDNILEIAVSIADLRDPFNVKEAYHGVFFMPDDVHDTLDPFIIDMHTKNGLLVECAKSRLLSKDAEAALLKLIPEIEDKDDRPTLAGSSVHFDHAFIKNEMPKLSKRLSHRHYDVSALKLFCQSLGMPKFKKAQAHRAKDDILESIAHGKECTEWLRKNLGRNPTNVHMH